MYSSDTCRDMASCAVMVCSTAAHLLHALTTSSPFLHPLFPLPHEYIKVHAFLPNITCVHEQTDPSLSLLAASPHFPGTSSCAYVQQQPSGSFPFSVFSFVPLFIFSVLYSFSRLAFFNCMYIYTYIFTYFNLRKLEFYLSCT